MKFINAKSLSAPICYVEPNPVDPTEDYGGGSGGYGGGGGSVGGGVGAGSGGAIGGYTLPNSVNYSGYTGVGSGVGYNAFTPYNLMPSKQLKGNEEIKRGGGPIISFLQSLFGQYRSGQIDSSTAISEASQAQSILYDANYYKQDVSKGSLKELTSLKSQAQNIVNSIAAWIAPLPPVTTTVPSTTTTPTTDANTSDILSQLQGLLNAGAPSSSTFEAPPNLFQVTPDSQSNTTGSNMPKILILAAIAVGAYFLYKKYA